MKSALSIAGSDCSGGAGIQADLKTFCAHHVYGMSVVTALTAQNTLGVLAVHELGAHFVEQQMDAVFSDIFPDAVKIGMLANQEIIQCVAQRLTQHNATNIVLDPVMISTSGDPLLNQSAVATLIESLAPCAQVITPNLSELVVIAQALGISRVSTPQSKEALQSLTERVYDRLPKRADGTNVGVLSKGGHLHGASTRAVANDVLIENNKAHWFSGPRIDTDNTHGTGCTLSSAIATNLAHGESLPDACSAAKKYIQRALSAGLDLGRGSGPLCHSV